MGSVVAFVVAFVVVVAVIMQLMPSLHAGKVSPGEFPYDTEKMDSNRFVKRYSRSLPGTGWATCQPASAAPGGIYARLYTAVAQERLGAGEPIVREHHVIRSHMALTQSVLKDPQQEMISLFVTDRRLLRVRSVLTPGRPVTCDRRDRTVVDDLPFGDIEGIRVHRQVRWGEVMVGLSLAGFAYLCYNLLSVTGPATVGLGLLGALHGLLLPTRWIELQASAPIAEATFCVYALRKKSGRKLLRMVREKMRFTNQAQPVMNG